MYRDDRLVYLPDPLPPVIQYPKYALTIPADLDFYYPPNIPPPFAPSARPGSMLGNFNKKGQVRRTPYLSDAELQFQINTLRTTPEVVRSPHGFDMNEFQRVRSKLRSRPRVSKKFRERKGRVLDTPPASARRSSRRSSNVSLGSFAGDYEQLPPDAGPQPLDQRLGEVAYVADQQPIYIMPSSRRSSNISLGSFAGDYEQLPPDAGPQPLDQRLGEVAYVADQQPIYIMPSSRRSSNISLGSFAGDYEQLPPDAGPQPLEVAYVADQQPIPSTRRSSNVSVGSFAGDYEPLGY